MLPHRHRVAAGSRNSRGVPTATKRRVAKSGTNSKRSSSSSFVSGSPAPPPPSAWSIGGWKKVPPSKKRSLPAYDDDVVAAGVNGEGVTTVTVAPLTERPVLQSGVPVGSALATATASAATLATATAPSVTGVVSRRPTIKDQYPWLVDITKFGSPARPTSDEMVTFAEIDWPPEQLKQWGKVEARSFYEGLAVAHALTTFVSRSRTELVEALSSTVRVEDQCELSAPTDLTPSVFASYTLRWLMTQLTVALVARMRVEKIPPGPTLWWNLDLMMDAHKQYLSEPLQEFFYGTPTRNAEEQRGSGADGFTDWWKYECWKYMNADLRSAKENGSGVQKQNAEALSKLRQDYRKYLRKLYEWVFFAQLYAPLLSSDATRNEYLSADAIQQTQARLRLERLPVAVMEARIIGWFVWLLSVHRMAFKTRPFVVKKNPRDPSKDIMFLDTYREVMDPTLREYLQRGAEDYLYK